MNHKWVTREYSESLNYASLDELEALVKKARADEAAGTWRNFNTDTIQDRYDDSTTTYLCGERLETDKELAEREAYEAQQQIFQAEYERKQYEQLKAKFEGNK